MKLLIIITIVISSGTAISSEQNFSYFPHVLNLILSDCDNPEFHLQKLYEDHDKDGIGTGEEISVCASNNPTLEGYSAHNYDCNDFDDNVWRRVVTYQDIDGDGIGSGVGTVVCIGQRPPNEYSIYGYDPLDMLGNPESTTVTDFSLSPAILSSPTIQDGKTPRI